MSSIQILYIQNTICSDNYANTVFSIVVSTIHRNNMTLLILFILDYFKVCKDVCPMQIRSAHIRRGQQVYFLTYFQGTPCPISGKCWNQVNKSFAIRRLGTTSKLHGRHKVYKKCQQIQYVQLQTNIDRIKTNLKIQFKVFITVCNVHKNKSNTTSRHFVYQFQI